MSFTETDVDLAVPNNGQPVRRLLNNILKSLKRGTGGLTFAQLQALTRQQGGAVGTLYRVTDGQGRGDWIVTNDDISSFVTVDTRKAVYVPFYDDVTGASGGFVRQYDGDLNFRWFGAVADGYDASPTENLPQLQAAAALGNLLGKAIYAPAGEYGFNVDDTRDPGDGVDPGNSFVLRGDGIGKTIFRIQFGTGTHFTANSGAFNLFDQGNVVTAYSSTKSERFVMEDMEVRGWEAYASLASQPSNANEGGLLCFIANVRVVRFDRVKWKDIPFFATDIQFCKRIVWKNCEFKNIARDAARGRDCSSYLVEGCIFEQVGDDPVACAVDDAFVDEQETAEDAVRYDVRVINNTFIHTGVCKVLGGRMTDISHNTFILCNRAPISVSSDNDGAGNVNLFSTRISFNKIFDPYFAIDGNTTAVNPLLTGAINVTVNTPRAGTNSNSVFPGAYDSSISNFRYWWNYQYEVTDISGSVNNPHIGCVIEGNEIRRTLPAATNISDYGYGYAMRQGVLYDPEVQDSDLYMLTGISCFADNALHYTRIINNEISQCSNAAITLQAANVGAGWRAPLIAGNVAVDCGRSFLQVNQMENADGSYGELVVKNNIIDVDPYRRQTNSNINGSYTANGAPFVIFHNDPTGLSTPLNRFGINLSDNDIKNVCSIFSDTADQEFNNVVRNNTVYCQPAAPFFSTSNKGWGNVYADPTMFNIVVQDSDPTSATYGQTLSIMRTTSPDVPTSGTYVAGWFVHNSDIFNGVGGTPAERIDELQTVFNGRSILHGWRRLTTGSNHVLGTDWFPVFGFEGTTALVAHKFHAAGRISDSGFVYASSQNVTSVSRPTTGNYEVTLASGPGGANFPVMVSAEGAGLIASVSSLSNTAPHFVVNIRSDSGVATNAPFQFVVYST